MNSQHDTPSASARRGSCSTSPESSPVDFAFLRPLAGAAQILLSETETVTHSHDDIDRIAIRREAIAAVPVRVTDRHGNAIVPSDPTLFVVRRITLSCTVF
jgi:hypothetical protein